MLRGTPAAFARNSRAPSCARAQTAYRTVLGLQTGMVADRVHRADHHGHESFQAAKQPLRVSTKCRQQVVTCWRPLTYRMPLLGSSAHKPPPLPWAAQDARQAFALRAAYRSDPATPLTAARFKASRRGVQRVAQAPCSNAFSSVKKMPRPRASLLGLQLHKLLAQFRYSCRGPSTSPGCAHAHATDSPVTHLLRWRRKASTGVRSVLPLQTPRPMKFSAQGRGLDSDAYPRYR